MQEAKLGVAQADLDEAQATLDEKQAELDEVQALYDAAMKEKQVRCEVLTSEEEKLEGHESRFFLSNFPVFIAQI